jgi:hypothetical protein
MYVDPPQKLIDLCLFASLMRQGAKSLGGFAAAKTFDNLLISSLRGNNWPIEDRNDAYFGPLQEFILDKLSSFSEQSPRYSINTSIAAWLQESASEVTREFLSNPGNLKVLEKTLNWILETVTTAYGNPLEAAPLSNSYLKQSFDAIKGSTVESKTQRLDEILAFVSSSLQDYNKNKLPLKKFLQLDLLVNEFWQRMQENLTAKDWPFSQKPSKTGAQASGETLISALKLMTASGSYAKLINALEKLAKSDPETMPADKAEEVAWSANFILNNSKDVREAAKAIFQELEKEAKTSQGINLVRSALSQKISLN